LKESKDSRGGKRSMLTMKVQNELRELFYEQGCNMSQIEVKTGHTRKTVSKYINKSDWNSEKVKKQRDSKIDKYKPDIDTWLTDDKKARRKQRHTATRVYTRLKETYGDSFNCSYKTVANYVANKKKDLFKVEKGFIPLQHIYGEAQVDFGKADFMENGINHQGSYLVITFPSSNAGYIQLFKGENCECLFEGLKNIFNHIGGVPTKLWFDNMSSIVTTIKQGGDRDVTDSYYRFKQHYGFGATFCNPNSGNEKGSVENKVGYHRRNFLVPIPDFKTLKEYNKYLLRKCEEDHKRLHYIREVSINELFNEDKQALLNLPEKEYLTHKYESVHTNGYGKFTLNAGLHSYSTSPKHANEIIIVSITAYDVEPLDGNYKTIVSHPRLYGNTRQEQMDWIPYLTQISRKPRALKYSGVYNLFPENVKSIFNNDEIKNHSEILKILAEVTNKSSFEIGIKVLESALKYNKYDTESLRAMYNGIVNPFIELPPIQLPDNTPKLIENIVDLSIYDKVFIESNGAIC
jgi:transposase